MSGSDITLGATVEGTDVGARAPVGRVPVRGDRLGRYTIIEEIGRGAMGIVYAAQDPDLDRRVALKVIAADVAANPSLRRNLLREARTLAQLSSPYVVGVFDVNESDNGVPFVAMELVQGVTLRAWVETPQRSRREILSAYADAAHGLIAIHAAGLVHHDFKPDNAIVGRDHRVRVADFGLARGGTRLTRLLTPDDVAKLPHNADLDLAPTMPHAPLRGTPAYMAPELWAHADATPSTDQYAWCVSLFEALLDRRPFAGTSPAEIVHAQQRGELGDFGGLPNALVALLRRGLAVDATQRFVSMTEVLRALEFARGSGARRRRRAVVGVLVVGAPLIAWLALDEGGRCQQTYDAVQRSWHGTRAHVRAAIRDLEQLDAAPIASSVERSLDTWTDALADGYRDACLAAEASPDARGTRDNRVACLDRSRATGGALVDALVTLDVSGLSHAVKSVHSLPDPALCADSQSLAAGGVEPAAGIPEGVPGLDVEIDALAAGVKLRVDGLQHRVEVAVERAAAIGYPPQHARALTQLARLAYNGQQYATAQRVARSAYEISASSDHARIAAGSAWLVAAAALGSRELETAAEFSEIAIGLSRHVDAVLLARAESLRAAVYRTSGDFEGARALGESAVARLERSQAAGSLRMAESYTALAATLGEMGELDEATHYATAAREIFASVEGERSRGALNVRNELAILRGLSGDHEGATELHKEVLEARIDALGAQDPDVAQSWINLAGSQYAAGQHEQAASTGLVGAELQAELRGADHPLTAAAYFNVAAVLLQLDRFVEAEVLLRRSHEAIIARLGADHPDTILSGCGLSFALLALGRDEAAAQVTGRAAAVAERHLDAQAAGTALYDRARLRLVAGDYVGVLDDARRIREILAAQRPEDASLRSQAQRWFEMNGIVI